MAYRIEGLAPEPFEPLFAMRDEELAELGARRVTADSRPGFPCRVSLEDAEPGERLILTHHVSNDVEGPFRSAYAIYVRESARCAAILVDETPPVFAGRTIALRGLDGEGNLRAALLAPPGQAETAIVDLFARPEVAEIHAHNAAAGCFAARIVRD